MNTRLAASILSAVLLSSSAFASRSLKLQAGAELSIDGKSTVRDFTCKAKTVDARVSLNQDLPNVTLEELAQAVSGARLEVVAKTLDCANETMNEHMHAAIGADKHQTIVVQINRYELGNTVEGAAPLKLFADITLAGVTRPVTILANAKVEGGALRVEGRYALRMTEWGVKPPSLMLGTMKVRDSVVIRFQLALKP